MAFARRFFLALLATLGAAFTFDQQENYIKSYKGLHSLLQDGYCVTSLGNVYGPGGDAAQRAIDDAVYDGATKVYWGAATYNPVTVSTTNRLETEVIGCGRDTYLDGGSTAPGLTVENPNYDQLGTVRLRLFDFAVTTDGDSTLPGVRFDGAHEVWLTRVMSQSPGGYGFEMLDSALWWMSDCFSEGAGDNALRVEYTGNKNCGDWEVHGGKLRTQNAYAISLYDANAPSGTIHDAGISCGVGYDQANYGWLRSNGCTNNVSVGGGGGMQSGDTDMTADDNIATYGLS